jgi:hypothetical protein
MNYRRETEFDADATTRIYVRRGPGDAPVEPARIVRPLQPPLPQRERPAKRPMLPARQREGRAGEGWVQHDPSAWRPNPAPSDTFEPASEYRSARSAWTLWLVAAVCACACIAVVHLGALLRAQLGDDSGHGRLVAALNVQNSFQTSCTRSRLP